MDNVTKIVKLMLEDAEKETHRDRVSCIHAVLMRVNRTVDETMRKIRVGERK